MFLISILKSANICTRNYKDVATCRQLERLQIFAVLMYFSFKSVIDVQYQPTVVLYVINYLCIPYHIHVF